MDSWHQYVTWPLLWTTAFNMYWLLNALFVLWACKLKGQTGFKLYSLAFCWVWNLSSPNYLGKTVALETASPTPFCGWSRGGSCGFAWGGVEVEGHICCGGELRSFSFVSCQPPESAPPPARLAAGPLRSAHSWTCSISSFLPVSISKSPGRHPMPLFPLDCPILGALEAQSQWLRALLVSPKGKYRLGLNWEQ